MRAPAAAALQVGGRQDSAGHGKGPVGRRGGCSRVRMRQTPPWDLSASRRPGQRGGRTARVLAGWAWRAAEWRSFWESGCLWGQAASPSICSPALLSPGAQTPRGAPDGCGRGTQMYVDRAGRLRGGRGRVQLWPSVCTRVWGWIGLSAGTPEPRAGPISHPSGCAVRLAPCRERERG